MDFGLQRVSPGRQRWKTYRGSRRPREGLRLGVQGLGFRVGAQGLAPRSAMQRPAKLIRV